MTKLPIVSGETAIKKFCKIGYRVIRQKGSHVRLRHSDSLNHKPLTIPLHKNLKLGLLHQLIKDAKLTTDEFIEL